MAKCKYCESTFKSKNPKKRFCSDRCRVYHYRYKLSERKFNEKNKEEERIKQQRWIVEPEQYRLKQLKQGFTTYAFKTDKQLVDYARVNNILVDISNDTIWGNPFTNDDGDLDYIHGHYLNYLDVKTSLNTKELRGFCLYTHDGTLHNIALARDIDLQETSIGFYIKSEIELENEREMILSERPYWGKQFQVSRDYS